jgi:hypothetical protein
VHVPVPEHPSPNQPRNLEPGSDVAVSVTVVPSAKATEHVEPQLSPLGLLVTVPVPVPIPLGTTVSTWVGSCEGGGVVKKAVTAMSAFAVTVHVGEGVFPGGGRHEKAPPQRTKVPPLAVSVTAVPGAKGAEHVLLQLIPAGLLVTVPAPCTCTLRVTGGGGGVGCVQYSWKLSAVPSTFVATMAAQ